jgi:hypothetical protein
MAIHQLFKILLNVDTRVQDLAKKSTPEIAYMSWEKRQKEQAENETYLHDIYSNDHEIPRLAIQSAYNTYMLDKEAHTESFYKTRKTEQLNTLVRYSIPESIMQRQSGIYTKYYLPNSLNT